MRQTCKDCSQRHPACWSSCPKYLEAKALHDKQKQEAVRLAMVNDAINAVQYHGIRKR